jgi:hypothetical protein
MQQTPQQMAMPQGMPSQMGIGALAAQRQQGGQADPRLMAMMQALGGNRPQPAMPMGPRVDQFGRPSATGQFAFDPEQQQRMAQAGLTPDQLAQMTPDQMAKLQPMAPVDIDPRTGRPIDAQMQSQIMAQQAFANQQQGGMIGGMPVQRPMPFDPRRPMPVGAGGKGAGAGPRVMETIGNPKGTRPGVPSTMINPPRPMVANNPRAQAAQSANPLLAQMMRGGSR